MKNIVSNVKETNEKVFNVIKNNVLIYFKVPICLLFVICVYFCLYPVLKLRPSEFSLTIMLALSGY